MKRYGIEYQEHTDGPGGEWFYVSDIWATSDREAVARAHHKHGTLGQSYRAYAK